MCVRARSRSATNRRTNRVRTMVATRIAAAKRRLETVTSFPPTRKRRKSRNCMHLEGAADFGPNRGLLRLAEQLHRCNGQARGSHPQRDLPVGSELGGVERRQGSPGLLRRLVSRGLDRAEVELE